MAGVAVVARSNAVAVDLDTARQSSTNAMSTLKKFKVGSRLNTGSSAVQRHSHQATTYSDDTYVEMKGNVKNESSAGLAIGVALIPVVTLLFIGAPLGMLIKNQNEVKKALLDTFEPWKAKGIRLEYFPSSKAFSWGPLFSLATYAAVPAPTTNDGWPANPARSAVPVAQLPGQMYQQQPGQMYQQQPGQMYQQPGQPGMVIQMVQQPGGAFYNQAQQGAQEPKQ